ncbi:hypothetical protein [Acetobacterium woodii]|uniref:hypothetical protein n=1 Tax=Acetobacterium woodii TaxID=33952 RepID=UPI00031944B7|nr:hypothetical protein [Acetobacterium woodii]
MNDLSHQPAIFRSGGVILAGDYLVDMTPSVNQVPYLIKNLFNWAKEVKVRP